MRSATSARITARCLRRSASSRCSGGMSGWVVAGTAHARHREDDAPHLIYFPEMRAQRRPAVRRCRGRLPAAGPVCGSGLRRTEGRTGRMVRRRTGDRARACEIIAGEYGAGAGAAGLGRGPGCARAPRSRGCWDGRARRWRPKWIARSRGDAARLRCGPLLEGESGQMVSIRRLPGERYESEMALVPLESVARIERTLPFGVDERGSRTTCSPSTSSGRGRSSARSGRIRSSRWLRWYRILPSCGLFCSYRCRLSRSRRIRASTDVGISRLTTNPGRGCGGWR